ncbi:MAG: class I SAM-dependent methyltransferase [Chitinophagaceae bacterium]
MCDAVVKEYARQAKTYDKRWKHYVEATTKETLSRLHLKGSETLLDVGCGTGVLLYRLSKKYPAMQLSGVDPVKEMLNVARQKLPSSIDLREGWATQLPITDHQFDVVICCSMFHYIRDPQAALNEIRQVLRPDGRLVITDWCNDFFTMRLTDLFLRCFNQAHFRSYGVKNIKNLLAENHFTVVDIDHYKISRWWEMMMICATA